jgi:2-oxoglutarate ferredoxin oxidoreductase subunit beta
LLCEVIEELDIEGRAIGITGGGCTSRWVRYIDVDMVGGIHGPGPAIATAIKRIHPEAVVFAIQGDGEQGAIGLGYFISTVLRAEKLTIISMNNACFGTTGGQMAPTTLLGMRTSTTISGRDPAVTGFPLHAPELAATMKGTAYSVRVSVHTPVNRQRAKAALKSAFQKQIEGLGLSLIEFISACPPNWQLSPTECLKFIEEKMLAEYPLGEFKNVVSIDYSIPGRK